MPVSVYQLNKRPTAGRDIGIPELWRDGGHCRVPSQKAMAPHSSTLAWKIPWTEEPGRLQSMGSGRVGHKWETSLSLFTLMRWRRKWQPTPVFLPGESQGLGSLVGCCLWGRTESDTTKVIWWQQQQQWGSIALKSGSQVLVLALPPGCCVTSDKYSHCKMGTARKEAPTYKTLNTVKALHTIFFFSFSRQCPYL